jgi:aromatic ring-opening dioxygenase LigB subunit
VALTYDQIFKAVEGACYNALHSHPKWQMDVRLTRSIAKRAAGSIPATRIMTSTLARDHC